MRKLLILAAAAAVSAACHNRNDDQVGAAPDQGRTDTTAVTRVLDSTRTGPPGEAGRPGNATVTADSVGLDSTAARQTTDSTRVGQDSSLNSTPQDTLGPRNPGAGAIDTTGVRPDTSVAPSSTSVPSDTAASDTTTSDTTKTNH
jgi:hypothetical protein